jgi:hypothetical protein
MLPQGQADTVTLNAAMLILWRRSAFAARVRMGRDHDDTNPGLGRR